MSFTIYIARHISTKFNVESEREQEMKMNGNEEGTTNNK